MAQPNNSLKLARRAGTSWTCCGNQPPPAEGVGRGREGVSYGRIAKPPTIILGHLDNRVNGHRPGDWYSTKPCMPVALWRRSLAPVAAPTSGTPSAVATVGAQDRAAREWLGLDVANEKDGFGRKTLLRLCDLPIGRYMKATEFSSPVRVACPAMLVHAAPCAP